MDSPELTYRLYGRAMDPRLGSLEIQGQVALVQNWDSPCLAQGRASVRKVRQSPWAQTVRGHQKVQKSK